MWNNNSSDHTITYAPETIESHQDPDEDLRRRQREHLARVRRVNFGPASACMHNQCPKCVGTGVKQDGSMCVHMLSCPCPRCTPRC